MKGIIHGLMVRLFVRLGSKCFNSMAVYSPGEDRGHIKAIHWAVNDYHLHSSVAELAEEHRGAFTLQLLTACQHDTIKEAQRSLPSQELYLVTKKVNGRACFRICLGTFESRESAGRALAGLPAGYRAGGAVRPVLDVLDRDR